MQEGTVVGKERACVMCINFHLLDNKETLQDFKWANDMIMFLHFGKGITERINLGPGQIKLKKKNSFVAALLVAKFRFIPP